MGDINRQIADDLYHDALARKVGRFLFAFLPSTLIVGFFLLLIRLKPLGFFLAFVSLVLVLGVLSWSIIRYQENPDVQEKKRLKKKAGDLKGQVAKNDEQLQRAREKREELKRKEQAEMEAALNETQNEYVRIRMEATWISDADLPGIGRPLKLRLAEHGYSSAADVSPRVSSVDGFGPY